MKKIYIFITLLSLALFHFINNYIVLSLDSAPLLWHPGLYFRHSCEFFEILKSGSWKALANAFFHINPVYPPLLFLSPAPLYFLFGNSPDTAILIVSALYFTVLIFSLYLLSREFTDIKTSLLATFLCSFFPAIFGYSRMFLMAVPSVALIVMSTYFLVRSRCFKHFGFSLAFGLSLALAMLMKKYNIITFAGIFIGYFIDNRKHISKKSFVYVSLAAVVCLSLVSRWYIINFKSHLAILEIGRSIIGIHPITTDPNLYLSFKDLLIRYQLGIVFFMLFINALFLVLIRKKSSLMLLLWIAWPFLLYSAICIEKSSRYTLPILPAIALIIALGIKELFTLWKFKSARLLKTSIIILLLFYSIFNYLNLTYGQEIRQCNLVNDPQRFMEQGFMSPHYINFDLHRLTRHFQYRDNESLHILDASGWCYIANEALYNYLAYNKPSITFSRSDYETYHPHEIFERMISVADFLIFYSYDGTDVPNVPFHIQDEPIEMIQKSIEIFKEKYNDQFLLVEKIYESDEVCDRALLLFKRKS